MGIHLVGGGNDPRYDIDVYTGFVIEAAQRAARREPDAAARIAVITVREGGETDHAARLADALTTAAAAEAAGGVSIEPVIGAFAEGGLVDQSALEGIDALVVGGGLTPAYLDALLPLAETIQAAVVDGMPYLGFSAGAMIAPDRALIGGWRIGGVEVSPQDGSEDLDEVTVVPGLGLVDVTVDVHAVQWGNLSRLIAAVDAQLVDGGVAIDEHTVLSVGSGPLRAAGAGTVWAVTRGTPHVQVQSIH